MQFGNYYIGQEYKEISEQVFEISKSGYPILPKTFKDEKIYKGIMVAYCEERWETTIGVTQGRVYKISLQTENKPFNSEKSLWQFICEKYEKEFLTPAEKKRTEDTLGNIWETQWGNLIVSNTKVPMEDENFMYVIGVTATGSFAFNKRSLFQRILKYFK